MKTTHVLQLEIHIIIVIVDALGGYSAKENLINSVHIQCNNPYAHQLQASESTK